MKRKDKEEALRNFFRHHPLEDAIYLKKYVNRHPDNKMAWYLLGREYAAKGEQGKAVYCYAQAGEVYEAFESEPVSLLLSQLGTDARHSGKRRGLLRKLRLVAVPLIVLLLSVYVPAADQSSRSVSVTGSVTGGAPAAVSVPQDAITANSAEGGKRLAVYYLSKEPDKQEIGAALQDIALPGTPEAGYSLVAQPSVSPDGRYRVWLGQARLLLEAERTGAAERLAVTYLDARACSCKPGDPERAQRMFKAWREEQEALVVLRSAIRAYALKYGQLPESIDRLVRPYPDNVLPGYTPLMKEQFPTELERVAAEGALTGSGAGGKPSGQALAAPASLLEPLAAPLEIVVDKQTHRLALVSGNVLLRSYPVGLGGERTPEGEFAITEKVRNPNGKSDGEFGSRGMTLSDTLYAIHGTNQPSSIGEDRSLGCVRMRKEDIEELFDMVPLGTKVRIGKGLVPAQTSVKEQPFQLPRFSEEENPHKTYKWLD